MALLSAWLLHINFAGHSFGEAERNKLLSIGIAPGRFKFAPIRRYKWLPI